MLFAHKVEILVVDDEPDVLRVTRLALRHTRVYGLPIEVHTAESRARAVELLDTTLATGIPGYYTAEVAFIDVVMETDHAGLELCDHIRNGLGNHHLQLFLRTGQPGVAPERDVIDRYDINGYLNKAEVTETKLYTMVKTGVREYHYLTQSTILGQVLQMLIPVARSREQIGATLDAFVASLQTSGTDQRHEGFDVLLAFFAGDEVFAGTWRGADGAKRRAELLRAPGRPLGESGDAIHVDGPDALLRIAADDTTVPLDILTRGGVAPPDFVVPLWHNFGRSLGALMRLGE
jgi:CheY-like chemotaxis protein